MTSSTVRPGPGDWGRGSSGSSVSLSHLSTRLFVDRSFEAEINYNNPLGTGGRLAIGFAVLLRALWKGTHQAFQPSKLKVREGRTSEVSL